MKVAKVFFWVEIFVGISAQQYQSGYFPHMRTSSCEYSLKYKGTPIPHSLDWRDHDIVTPVKNQGNCGSCWSFSATGAIEGAHALSSGKLLNISEQQLIDCSLKYGNQACGGGIMDNAFEYATDHELCSDDEAPYQAKYDEKLNECRKCLGKVRIRGCADIQPNNQTALKIAVAQQPVSVAIEADSEVFQMYRSGVITSKMCGTKIDHGVLVIGYGTEKGEHYWLVKNSWGSGWGDNGYVKILKNEEDTGAGICGIASQPSVPVV